MESDKVDRPDRYSSLGSLFLPFSKMGVTFAFLLPGYQDFPRTVELHVYSLSDKSDMSHTKIQS